MREFWLKAESCWNRNRTVAWVLVLLGIGLVVWSGFVPQSPGVSIGLLAGAAGIMSVRPKMHPAEKFAWVAVLVAFTILEISAIGRADKATEATRGAQNLAFKTIAEGLKTSIEQGKSQYGSTIDHVNGVLTKTTQVADLSRKNLTTVVRIEKQEEEAKERSDQDLCHEIDRVINNARPKVNGFYSFPRRLLQAQHAGKVDEQPKEVQKEADDYFHQGLRPELQSLVPKIRARLKIPEDVRQDYLKSVLDDSEFNAGEINGALEELKGKKQQICPAPKQP